MAKRERLEIIKDILTTIKDNQNSIKITPLLRRSNLSTKRFNNYFNELIKKEFIKKRSKMISLSKKGYSFLEEYKTIINFINEFEL